MNTVQPCLFFAGRCQEALEFYRVHLNARVQSLVCYQDCPEYAPGTVPPGFESKIARAVFRIGNTILIASDESPQSQGFNGFCLFLWLTTEIAVVKAFNALSQGGQVRMPPQRTSWSPMAAMVTDRFGVGWVIGVKFEL